MKLTFLGAVGTVTGSKYLLEIENKKIFIDCGLFQGLKKLRLLNWQPLEVDPTTIDFVLLTHAHLDHTGYLPRLVKQGFSGKVFGTAPTLQIAEIILKDSAQINEEDTERANKEKFSKHSPALPLYNSDDVVNTVNLFNNFPEGEWKELFKGVKVRFNYNSHILGATFIEIEYKDKIITFSGDIGRDDDLILNIAKKPQKSNFIIMESTYGGKNHVKNPEILLTEVINETLRKKGSVIIPSFAVERSQALMFLLSKLKKQKLIPTIPMFVDSPMAQNALRVFAEHYSWHKVDPVELQAINQEFIFNKSLKSSFKVINNSEPKIVIAGGGMGTGGRVLRYFEKYLSDSHSTIALSGYQAEGTRGRALLDGVKEIKIGGKFYPVRARIANIEGLSSHADQNGLVNWLGKLQNDPEKIFIIHGESNSSELLKEKLSEKFTSNSIIIPKTNDSFEL